MQSLHKVSYGLEVCVTNITFNSSRGFGVLGSGTYTVTSCSNPCTGTAWGTIVSGSSVTAYSSSAPVYPTTCSSVSQTRTCSNGTLSGTYTLSSCSQAYTYSWSTAAWGSCASSATYSTGAWGACSNTSCSGGSQTRTVTCINTAGTQTRSVTCSRNDGTTVSDSLCSGTKPATSQACTGSCSGSAPASSQSCSSGTPCRWTLLGARWTGPCQTLPSVSGSDPHGAACSSVGGGNSFFWATGPGVTVTCPAGKGEAVWNQYRCTLCASGNWVNTTINTTAVGTANTIQCQ